MARLSTGEAAWRCASELETAQETLKASYVNSMNRLAWRLSRQGDMSNVPAFVLALWGIEIDPYFLSSDCPDVIPKTLRTFDPQDKVGRVFAPSKATPTNTSGPFYSFGTAYYSPRVKRVRTRDNSGTIDSVAKLRVSFNDDCVIGEVVVPAFRVSANLFSRDPNISPVEPVDFCALRVVRDSHEPTPKSPSAKNVLWDREIPQTYYLDETAMAMSNLALIQETFQKTPGYNYKY